jgi:hypothetical protein
MVRVQGMFLQPCGYLDGQRVLLEKNLISNGGGQHVAGDVPSQSAIGQHGKHEKHKGCA